MSQNYKGFTINTNLDPPPWGSREQQCIEDIIDTVVVNTLSGVMDANGGHKHTKLYHAGTSGTVAVDATSSTILLDANTTNSIHLNGTGIAIVGDANNSITLGGTTTEISGNTLVNIKSNKNALMSAIGTSTNLATIDVSTNNNSYPTVLIQANQTQSNSSYILLTGTTTSSQAIDICVFGNNSGNGHITIDGSTGTQAVPINIITSNDVVLGANTAGMNEGTLKAFFGSGITLNAESTSFTAYAASLNLTSTSTIMNLYGSSGVKIAAGFGCNTKSPQAAVTVPASATDAGTTLTLVNDIRNALIANGILYSAFS